MSSNDKYDKQKKPSHYLWTQLKCGTRRCHTTIIWPQRYHFLSGAFCHKPSGIKAQFIIRKEEPMVLAHRASYDKKTLARQVIPLAPGYWTALSSRPGLSITRLILFICVVPENIHTSPTEGIYLRPPHQ